MTQAAIQTSSPNGSPPPAQFPLSPDKWQLIVRQLALSPQQMRIVELILRNFCDKEIAAEMGLKLPTVRTYLQRAYQRLGVEDRMALVLKILASSQALS